MANIKSAKKRIRSNERKRVRNLMYRSQVKTLQKRAEQAIAHNETNETAEEKIRDAIQKLDKAASKGILHKNNVARRKSRLMKRYNRQLQQQSA